MTGRVIPLESFDTFGNMPAVTAYARVAPAPQPTPRLSVIGTGSRAVHICPDCSSPFPSEAGLNLHRLIEHGADVLDAVMGARV